MVVMQYAGQAVFYAAVSAAIGYFSSAPVYQQFPPQKAQIKIAFAHSAQRVEECRRLTPSEIAKLPPKERRPHSCSRERVSIHFQFVLDGGTLLDEKLPPTGLAGDGPARIYRKLAVSPGSHVVTARLRDSRGDGGFNYETTKKINLAVGQSLAIDFHADAGGFIFR